MSMVNILYYSNNCDGSKQLISMLNNEKLTNFFLLICTDSNPNIPKNITLTPTLVLRGMPTPYVASDAFAWLARIKQWKITVTMRKMNTDQQLLNPINNNLSVDKQQNLLGFSNAEMNGMSDIFSFFSQNISQECQDALPQTYFQCSNLGQENIFTPPLEDGTFKANNNKCKINTTMQKEMQNKLETDRKKQDELFRQNMDNFRKQYDNKN